MWSGTEVGWKRFQKRGFYFYFFIADAVLIDWLLDRKENIWSGVVIFFSMLIFYRMVRDEYNHYKMKALIRKNKKDYTQEKVEYRSTPNWRDSSLPEPVVIGKDGKIVKEINRNFVIH